MSEMPEGLAETLAEDTRRNMSGSDQDAALAAVTALAVETGLADHAGITERQGKGRFRTSGATDDLVVVADHQQYELDEGPCVRASYEEGILTSLDIAGDQRWARWGPAARALGVHSVMSVHLYTSDTAMGALNLYSMQPRTYSEDDRARAHLVGAHASITLAHFRGKENLWKAIDARHATGMAQGILRHQYGITTEQALSLMIRSSQQRQIKLQDLAARIVRDNSGDLLREHAGVD